MVKNISKLSILIDSKIVDVNQSNEEDFVEIKYENEDSFYMSYGMDEVLNKYSSYSKFMYSNDDFDIKEFLMIISEEYLSDKQIDILKKEGYYEYEKDDITIVYTFKDSDINILEAKFLYNFK